MDDIGIFLGIYVVSNLAFTTFSGYQIKTYDLSKNQIITKPRQINLGNLNDKLMPLLYSYELTHNSEILFENGDRVEFDKRIKFLETCLCQMCSKKTQMSFEDILFYYDKSENKILKGISYEKYVELFSNHTNSFCSLNPVFPQKQEIGILYKLKIN